MKARLGKPQRVSLIVPGKKDKCNWKSNSDLSILFQRDNDMCMKYEKEYEGSCWDYLFFKVRPEKSLTVLLTQNYGVDIEKPEEFAQQMMALFAAMHESGIIRPAVIYKE